MTCVILIKEDSFAEPEAIQSKADTKVKADDMINWDKFCSHSAVCARTVPRTECVWVCVYMKACVCIHTIFWVYMLYSDEGWPDQARWDVVPQKSHILEWTVSLGVYAQCLFRHSQRTARSYASNMVSPTGAAYGHEAWGDQALESKPCAGSEQTHTCHHILNKLTFYVTAVNIAV